MVTPLYNNAGLDIKAFWLPALWQVGPQTYLHEYQMYLPDIKLFRINEDIFETIAKLSLAHRAGKYQKLPAPAQLSAASGRRAMLNVEPC